MSLDIHKILEIDYRLENGDRPKSKEHMKMIEDCLLSEYCVGAIKLVLEKELKEKDLLEDFDLHKGVKSQACNISSLIKSIYENRYVATKYENFDKIFEENYEYMCIVLSRLASDDLFKVSSLAERLQIPFLVFLKFYDYLIKVVIVDKINSRKSRVKLKSSSLIDYIKSVIQWYTGNDHEGRHLFANFILQRISINSELTFNESLVRLKREDLAKKLIDLNRDIFSSEEKRLTYIKLCDYYQFSPLNNNDSLNLLINELSQAELMNFLSNYETFHASMFYNTYLSKDSDYIKYMSQNEPKTLEEFTKEILISYFKDQNLLIQDTRDEDSPSPVFRLSEIENALCANSVTVKSAFNYYIEKSLKLILNEHKTKSFNPIQLTLAAYAVKSVNSWLYSKNRQLTSKLLFEKLSNKTIDTEYISKIFGHIVLGGFKKELHMTEDEELLISEDVVIEWLIEMHCSDKKDTESWVIPFLNQETYDKYVK